MKKTLGLLGFLLALVGVTCFIQLKTTGAISFMSLINLSNLLTWVGLFGIITLGQTFAIITGGIDLSAGSLIALSAVCTAKFLDKGDGYPVMVVIPAVLLMAGAIGAFHGVLITKLRIQAFVVTLCGLFSYRGIARVISGGFSLGFGNSYNEMKWYGRGTLGDWASDPVWAERLSVAAAPFLIFIALSMAVAAYLHYSASGRHLFALGANEEGARLSGVRTDRLKITAYTLCALLTSLGGILFAFKGNSIQATDFGNGYELLAIAGVVLGGCSLRGGAGSIPGVVIGVAIIQMLFNMVNLLGIPSDLVYVVIGGAILLGVCADEMLQRRGAGARRAAA